MSPVTLNFLETLGVCLLAAGEILCLGIEQKPALDSGRVVLKVREDDGDRALWIQDEEGYVVIYVSAASFLDIDVGDSVAYEGGVRIER